MNEGLFNSISLSAWNSSQILNLIRIRFIEINQDHAAADCLTPISNKEEAFRLKPFVFNQRFQSRLDVIAFEGLLECFEGVVTSELRVILVKYTYLVKDLSHFVGQD